MLNHMRRGPTSSSGTGYPTQLGIFWATSNGTQQFPATTAQKTIVQQAVHNQLTTVNNTGPIVGATATSSTPFASYDGLPQLDARITTMEQSKSAEGYLTIVLNAAPWWMMGKPSDGDYSTVNNYTVLDANLGVWGDFCAFLADRYASQGVTHMIVWSEQKGYFNNSLNRWDYERLTAMYNSVWTKVKAAQPTMLIGGPYITTRSALQSRSGIPTVANDGSSIVSSLQVQDETWHVDARTLNTVLYWRDNALGWDFKVFDISMWQSNNAANTPSNPFMAPTTAWPVGTPNTVQHVDGSIVFDDREKATLIGQWLNAAIPDGKPIWSAESYAGSGIDTAADFEIMYAAMQAGGIGMMNLWHGPSAPRVGSQLWAPGTDTRTVVGDAAAAHTSVVG